MIGRQRGKNHLMLQRDKMKPLLNRALMGVYPPGSTFKTAQGLTFLQEGIVTEQGPSFPCSRVPLRQTDGGMSCPRSTDTTYSCYCYIVQLLFLLGTVPYVRRP